MNNRDEKVDWKKKLKLPIVGFGSLLALALCLIGWGEARSMQSSAAMYPKVEFRGEYRVGEGEWNEIVKGKHIPATKGDVVLRGTFHLVMKDGSYLGPAEKDIQMAFYLNHIHAVVYEKGQEPHIMDNENPAFGAAACGKRWIGYSLKGDSTEPVEIVIHNPHSFGNDIAVDEFLMNLSTWLNIDFEREMIDSGRTQISFGLVFIIISLILLGSALVLVLLHLKRSGEICLLGIAVFFAGAYYVYSSAGVPFWSESATLNANVLSVCMMFYMLSVTYIIVRSLNKTRMYGQIAVAALGMVDGLLFILPVFEITVFYDVLGVWAFIQTIANVILFFGLIDEYVSKCNTNLWRTLEYSAILIAFEIDVAATICGFWQGGFLSRYVVVPFFVDTLIMILKVIPGSINASMKARELEAEKNALDAELAKSRISTMISQIRPHFIYNTLGSIEYLCELNPAKAAELVHNFSKYLRSNFSELDNPKPIRMSQEMEHVKYYVSIENVRFPDMVFTFDMNSVDFELPALTIQPIIENAIKHGLMKLKKGGSIHVASFETEKDYCVRIEDDGVGFDMNILLDERKHIGLRNIRGRLEAMVGGSLEIESTIGVGTVVMIKIPKEEKK